MQMQDIDDEDIFFDAHDSIRTATEPPSCNTCGTSGQGSDQLRFIYGLWMEELVSIKERRSRFLCESGFGEFVSSPECSTSESSLELLQDRSMKSHNSTPDLSSDLSRHNKAANDYAQSVTHGGCEDVSIGMKTDISSNYSKDVKRSVHLRVTSPPIQKFLKRNAASICDKFRGVGWHFNANAPEKCKINVHLKDMSKGRFFRSCVSQMRKKFLELSALYLGQEIQAHEGLIRVMKFNPSGKYLASGGEDCIVRIWQITELATNFMPPPYSGETVKEVIDDLKCFKSKMGKSRNCALAVIPAKKFTITEKPLHTYYGHTSGILDLCWSKSDCLLTSSKDKTVRLWKVGCHECVAVFRHHDYVTCIQFNPIDEGYFVSGSIDGKVRLWRLSDCRVVDWVDARVMLTALCYQPDGKGVVVGTITGTCNFYSLSGEIMQLEKQMSLQSKKKAFGNQITSLQYSPGNSGLLMVTSGVSKISICNDFGVVQKFKGLKKAKRFVSSSFTADGGYVTSVGLDSNIYIWNVGAACGTSASSSAAAKTVHACERFLSKGAVVAVPWPGLDCSHASIIDTLRRLQASSWRAQKSLDPSVLLRGSNCFSFGAWLMSEGITRAASRHPVASALAGWNFVIVTASSDGVIRAYHNYGLPIST